MKPIDFRVESAAVPADATVIGFRGTERVSAPYSFDLVFRTSDAELDGLGVVGETISLIIETRRETLLETPRTTRVHGIVTSLALASEEGDGALYHLTFAPRLQLLALSQHSRIFTDVTIEDVIAAVLEEEGIPADAVRMELETHYPVREHICQYKESSLAFIQRLMEREGIFYFFDHTGDSETLVITDDLSHYAELECGKVRYVPRSGADVTAEEALVEVVHERLALPGRIVLRDYDELQPSLELTSEMFVQQARQVVVDYGEHLLDSDQAARLTRVRAQAASATESRLIARGSVIGLHAGGTFERHDVVSPLPEKSFVVDVEHEAVAAGAEATALDLLGLDFTGGYRTNVTLLDADTQYRAPQTTPWPRVYGVEPAVVDGPTESAYAQIDEHGRYKVRLLFDEGDSVDGSQSTWVRMLQPHGGAPDGFHFPLRKDTEVLIGYMGGDPDRPTIIGVAPNLEKPATVTSSNGTQNVLRTGGNNLWELEDLAGSQRVLMSTPSQSTHLHLGAGGHQVELRTDGNGLLHFGSNFDVSVGAAKTETVAGPLMETYRATHTLSVTGASTRTFQANHDQTVTGPITNTRAATFVETVNGFINEIYNAGLTTQAGGHRTKTHAGPLDVVVSGGTAVENISGNRTVHVGATGEIIVSGAVTETYGATTRTVNGSLTETVTGTYTIKAPRFVVYAGDASVLDFIVNGVESTATKIAGIVTQCWGHGLSLTGFSKSSTDTSITLAGTTITNTGASASLSGLSVSVFGSESKMEASDILTAGLQFGVRAIHTVT